jgi:hypothetical protein
MFVRSQMLRRIIASLLNNLFSLIILNLERPQAWCFGAGVCQALGAESESRRQRGGCGCLFFKNKKLMFLFFHLSNLGGKRLHGTLKSVKWTMTTRSSKPGSAKPFQSLIVLVWTIGGHNHPVFQYIPNWKAVADVDLGDWRGGAYQLHCLREGLAALESLSLLCELPPFTPLPFPL